MGSDRCSAHLRLAGRKTSLTPAISQRIVQLLQGGVSLSVAYQAAGVPKRTFYDWYERGEDGPPLFRVFREAIDTARAEGEAVLAATIAKAAPDHWQAAAFLLERMYPERWARVSQRKEDESESPPADPFAEFDELAARRAPER